MDVNSHLGRVQSPHSPGSRVRHGSITKTGNVHVRKALVSAAWKFTHYPRRSRALTKRQEHCSARVVTISWKAQRRLVQCYPVLNPRMAPSKAVVAVARELPVGRVATRDSNAAGFD